MEDFLSHTSFILKGIFFARNIVCFHCKIKFAKTTTSSATANISSFQ